MRLQIRGAFNSGRFHDDAEWPLARARYAPLYLNTHQMLLESRAAKEGSVGYASAGRDSLSFTHCFERPTDLVGHAKLSQR